MPYLMTTSFDRFIEAISVTGDHRSTANTRRDRIGELLGKNLEILDLFPTGSLLRGTALKHSSDVDVIAVLHYGKHLKNKTPTQALQMVRDVLSEYDARIVKKNGQAVTLYFKTWPNVDIVPAVRIKPASDRKFEIPDTTTGRWIPTSPNAHDRAMTAASLRRKQLVRLVKAWNQAHSGYFQSFHIEQIALALYIPNETGNWSEADWPWSLVSFFSKAQEMTNTGTAISPDYEFDDWYELRKRLERAESRATEAWYQVSSNDDVRAAVDVYKVMFGSSFPSYG